MQTMVNGGGATVAGSKRRADDSSLSDSERFAKRFNLLNLGAETHGNSNYYIPVPKSARSAVAPATTSNASSKATSRRDDGAMQVDDTRDRIYIHDLDEELADVETDDEEKLIFLPDIEKRLSKIPKHILTGGRDDDHEGQELVLYSVPKSLTADEGSDSVRKAIVESRQRARQKAVDEARQLDVNCKYGQSVQVEPAETAHGYSAGYSISEDFDPDEMDMD